jgi:hypothetical protein
LGYS